MSRALSTLLLLAVALGLGAYIYFVESEREPASTATEVKDKAFAELDASTIEELTIRRADGETALRRENGQWNITQPLATKADETAVSGITSNLASLEVQRVVAENPGDLTQYGLAPPTKAEVTFRRSGETDSRTLLLGDTTATGGDIYAKLDDSPRVFLIAAYLDTSLNRSTFDLRDKAVLSVARDQVDGVEIVSGGRTLSFAKKGDVWQMTAPLNVRADFGTVDGLISRVTMGQMSGIVSDAPASLAEYGLDEPSGQITFATGSGRSSILFGGTTPDGQRYAKDASRPLVFTVGTFLADDLNKPPDDYRPKDVFEFRTFSGNRFEITRNGAATVFEKTTKEGETVSSWAQTQPAPAAAIESSRIEDVLSRISGLRAVAFVEALPAGATEVARASARWDDGKREETVTFSRAGDQLYAVRGSEPGAVTLTASDFDAAVQALEALE
jgi:hypothetical protein